MGDRQDAPAGAGEQVADVVVRRRRPRRGRGGQRRPAVGVEDHGDADGRAGAQPGQPLGLVDVERAEHGDEDAAEPAAAQDLDRAVERAARRGADDGQLVEQQPLGERHARRGDGLAAVAQQRQGEAGARQRDADRARRR